MFQSLIGRLKTVGLQDSRSGDLREFQSLIGRLKTRTLAGVGESFRQRFNPS